MRRPLNTLALAVAALTLASALPGGSAHPTASMVVTAAIFLTAGLFALTTGNRALEALQPHRTLLFLGAAFLGYCLWQALPVGEWVARTPAGPIRLSGHSLDPGASWIGALRLAGLVAFFALALQLGGNTIRAERLGRWLFFGIVAQAAYALIALNVLGDTFLGFPKIAYEGLATGTFVNRNTLATFLGMGLVLGLALLGAKRQGRARRRVLWIGVIVIFIALLGTQSRMGLAATGIAAALTFGGRIRPGRSTAVAGLALIVLLVAIFGQGLIERLMYVGASGQTRAELYAQILGMIRTVPLTGYGLDNFPLAYELFHAPPVTAEFVWDRAHSTYLSLWAECGVLAGSIPPLAAGLALARLYQTNAPTPLHLAARAALILAGLHSLVDFSLEIPAVTYLLLALTALGLGQPDTTNRKDPQS